MVIRTMIVLLLCLFAVMNASAHPFSQEEYSLRTAITISEYNIVPLVVLEIPIPIALKEIGAAVEDPRDLKRRKINAYNKKQWDTMANNLTFLINGESANGEWLAIEHPANGKATEGFFVYMVSFRYKKPIKMADTMTIEIQNTAYPESKMVYSGGVSSKGPWIVSKSTSKDVLGEYENAELTDPKRWSTDQTLRNLVVEVQKTTID